MLPARCSTPGPANRAGIGIHRDLPAPMSQKPAVPAVADVSPGESADEHAPLDGADADFGFRRRPGRERAARPPVDPFLGTVVGDVRLESLIGEGGMGRVYLGRQLRPDRAVAVKVIRPGMDTAAAVRRFERESEALARLRHPGIAQIHSFGTCAAAGADTPYFVMEFVPEARSITEHAAAGLLGQVERLRLFSRVCDAVAHAHSRGIIHRDLKPANILVDGAGEPKVIDFGVARHRNRQTILTTGLDGLERFVGTIQYMAPEQFHGTSADIDERADVYSLGVVLHELLCGRPPYDVRAAVLAHAGQGAAVENPPPLLSGKSRVPRPIRRIVRTCLEKDRRRRYASAVELAADIDRHLRGDRVLAPGGAIADGLRRAWQRHRAAGGFLAGTLAAVAALVAVESVGRHPARPAPVLPLDRRIAEPPTPVSVRTARGDPAARLDAAAAAMLEPTADYLTVEAAGLTPGAAATLAAKRCHLTLLLRTLDREVAGALAAHVDGLAIGGIPELTDDVAGELARYRGDVLNLDGFERLSAAACRRLVDYRGWLNMNGVKNWPPGGLEAIVRHRGGLSLRVAGLSTAQARVLATHRGELYVLGVESLDESAARELVRHEGNVHLWKAGGITPAAAAVLRQQKAIRFPGM